MVLSHASPSAGACGGTMSSVIGSPVGAASCSFKNASKSPPLIVTSSRSPISLMYVAGTEQCSGHSWSCHGSNFSPPGYSPYSLMGAVCPSDQGGNPSLATVRECARVGLTSSDLFHRARGLPAGLASVVFGNVPRRDVESGHPMDAAAARNRSACVGSIVPARSPPDHLPRLLRAAILDAMLV